MAAGKTFESKLGKQYYPVVLEHQDTLALLNSYMIQKYNIPAVDEKTSSPTAKRSGWNSSRPTKRWWIATSCRTPNTMRRLVRATCMR